VQHIAFADTSTGWAVTSNGEILSYALSRLAGIEPHVGLKVPASFLLYQNYPNPFNPSTVISYRLPGASEVTLAVFDILGRQVAVLENGRKAAGSYSIRFTAAGGDGQGLASGVYLCRLSANLLDGSQMYHQTMKMLILR
jgi:hypothetical protein